MAQRRRLRLPEEVASGLMRLIHLDDAELAELEAALQDVPPTLYHGTFVASVASRLSSVASRLSMDSEAAEDITQSLLFLYYARDVGRRTVSEFIDDLQFAMQSYDSEDDDGNIDLTPPNNDWGDFRVKMSRLLQYESAGVTTKSIGIMTAQANSYCIAESRIVSDIRPVFYGETPDQVKAAVIIHTLKIAYHTSDEVEEFYVALDSHDIRNLRKLLDRAEEKEKSLRAILDRENIPFLSFGEE